MAVYFRLNDDEIVGYGPSWDEHRILPVVEAVRLLRQQPDTQGWEIMIRRSIASRDIHKVRTLSQVLGWRYSPRSHTQPWCNCPVCVSRGEFNSKHLIEESTASLTMFLSPRLPAGVNRGLSYQETPVRSSV